MGIAHPLLGVSPWAFGEQFSSFMHQFFFKISDGLSEFPLLHGQMKYDNFAAFWFVYFGLMLIPFGMLVSYIEKTHEGQIPMNFIWAYFIFTLLGVYMIPFSGMTLLMLPHAVYMLISQRKLKNSFL